MTLCNMSIEAGARMGMVAVDDTALAYISTAPLPPGRNVGSGRCRLARSAQRRRCGLRPGGGIARDDTSLAGHLGHLARDGAAHRRPPPDPASIDSPTRRAAVERALEATGLQPGTAITGIKI